MLAALPWLRWRQIFGGDSRIACPEPELPEPRRKSPGSPALERPRLYSGAAGLARLGHSLLAQRSPAPWAACRSVASPGSSSPPRRAAVSPCAGTPSPPDAHIFPPSDFLRPGPSSSSTLASSTRCGCRAGSRGCAPRHQWRAHADMWLEPLAQEERDESSRRDGVLLGEGSASCRAHSSSSRVAAATHTERTCATLHSRLSAGSPVAGASYRQPVGGRDRYSDRISLHSSRAKSTPLVT